MDTSLPVRHHPTIDSTNLEAARLSAAGHQSSVWIRADEQTAGRGRAKRLWRSEPGGLYATVLLMPECDLRVAPQLSLVMSLAVYETIVVFVPAHRVKLKWPNDCLVDGAKISGILAEGCGSDPLRLALGCGINVLSAPVELPYRTSCLRMFAPDIQVDDVFDVLQRQTSSWLSLWRNGTGFPEIREAWIHRSVPLGTFLSVSSGVVVIKGHYAGLSGDGALLLEDEVNVIHAVYAGDVTMLDVR